MKIIAVIVTHNRLNLLPRALKSVAGQTRKPDFVYVISNSNEENFITEQEYCSEHGFLYFRCRRTVNHAGANNTAIEIFLNQHPLETNGVFFTSLDDDDEWLPNYLEEIAAVYEESIQILAGYITRINGERRKTVIIPDVLNTNIFLKGNPGISGLNTLVELNLLLQAGCYDEACISNIDRDLFVRLFQLNPKYKIVRKHLVNAYTDNQRVRVTNNVSIRKKSFQYFYYKYGFLMNKETKEEYFKWAERFFQLSKEDITSKEHWNKFNYTSLKYKFNGQTDIKLVVGFISDHYQNVERLLNQFKEQKLSPTLLLIIDNTKKGDLHEFVSSCENIKFVNRDVWQKKLSLGDYGDYFKEFDQINSIPLGRTILQHHLFTESQYIENPVFWVIDDDISLSITSINEKPIDFIGLIKEYRKKTDVIIGNISKDPPIPLLSCVRSQLVDLLHSKQANGEINADFMELHQQGDYYYDLSDSHSNHLEAPIYHQEIKEEHLKQIFSGKALSRPALQPQSKASFKTVSKRGANTLIFNREVLQLYPVINFKINDKFARRGDLLWALFNQLISKKVFVEHTFSLDHSRPLSEFNLKRELDKTTYDLIGYAFNKGLLHVMKSINHRHPELIGGDYIMKLNEVQYLDDFKEVYHQYLHKRWAKFVMNFYRIKGLLEILSLHYLTAKQLCKQFNEHDLLKPIYTIIHSSFDKKIQKKFIKQMTKELMFYDNKVFKGYKMAFNNFQKTKELAKKEISDYNKRIVFQSIPFDITYNKKNKFKNSLLFTTSTGLYHINLETDTCHKLLDGKFYGITKYQDYWLVTRMNNKGYRDHLVNNCISDVCALKIDKEGKINDYRVFIYGLPGDIHQIDIYQNILYIPHTDYNHILSVDMPNQFEEIIPLDISQMNCIELPELYRYSHLNSIFIDHSKIHLISHNYTLKTKQHSEWVSIDMNGNLLYRASLNAHSAHNIFLENDNLIFFDSSNGSMRNNEKTIFTNKKLLRGLSISDTYYFIGGSDITYKKYERFSNNPSIFILNRAHSEQLATIEFKGIGDIYEIRQFEDVDYSFSDTNLESK